MLDIKNKPILNVVLALIKEETKHLTHEEIRKDYPGLNHYDILNIITNEMPNFDEPENNICADEDFLTDFFGYDGHCEIRQYERGYY